VKRNWQVGFAPVERYIVWALLSGSLYLLARVDVLVGNTCQIEIGTAGGILALSNRLDISWADQGLNFIG
jgi:hypothetical protein